MDNTIEQGVCETWYTIGRLIEACDYILPQFKLTTDSSPNFSRLIDVIDDLHTSLKLTIESRNYSTLTIGYISSDITKLVRLCNGVRELINSPLSTLTEEEIETSVNSILAR